MKPMSLAVDAHLGLQRAAQRRQGEQRLAADAGRVDHRADRGLAHLQHHRVGRRDQRREVADLRGLRQRLVGLVQRVLRRDQLRGQVSPPFADERGALGAPARRRRSRPATRRLWLSEAMRCTSTRASVAPSRLSLRPKPSFSSSTCVCSACRRQRQPLGVVGRVGVLARHHRLVGADPRAEVADRRLVLRPPLAEDRPLQHAVGRVGIDDVGRAGLLGLQPRDQRLVARRASPAGPSGRPGRRSGPAGASTWPLCTTSPGWATIAVTIALSSGCTKYEPCVGRMRPARVHHPVQLARSTSAPATAR